MNPLVSLTSLTSLFSYLCVLFCVGGLLRIKGPFLHPSVFEVETGIQEMKLIEIEAGVNGIEAGVQKNEAGLDKLI